MTQIRPKGMTQGAFAELLRTAGFEACSKTAVSLAERPKDSGVQFTREARKAAQGLLKSTSRGNENRKNGRKTTVWLDDEMRSWCETQAYLRDVPVGELIRGLIRKEMENARDATSSVSSADTFPSRGRHRNTASDVGASEAVMETGGFGDPSFSDHNT